ncbi:uncharacterized protein LY89DRAFT_329901 [Mollisia scopiformis]|uniref:Uncharacterized protein n=1 Tax=Mollisia scopiformis TaxID=149040 RepID=A0A132B817_MOLSC|nr:uncharacterized protein LY89DRAFT_329901 [Mollisia scopiformis]KUJ08393.1 hypothetical protein LY89DRAFT_329901 [Mollisia scopiformis]
MRTTSGPTFTDHVLRAPVRFPGSLWHLWSTSISVGQLALLIFGGMMVSLAIVCASRDLAPISRLHLCCNQVFCDGTL